MEALIELCDLIAQNPAQFSDKLSWICDKCPPPEYLSAGSPRVSRSQLNAILAVARFLSKCSDSGDLRPKSVAVEFLRSIPYSFTQSFWPQPFSADSVASFFLDFLAYISKATELSPDFADEVAGFSGEVVLLAIGNCSEQQSPIARAFLVALSQNFLPISSSDANKLMTCLIEQFAFPIPVPSTPREHISGNSDIASSQSSPLSINHHSQTNHNGSPGNEVTSNVSGSSSSAASNDASTASSKAMTNGGSHIWKSSADQLALNLGLNDGAASSGQQVASFEEESVSLLEKQEIAFKLIAHILEKVQIEPALLEQVRLIGKKQIQSMSVFLKVKLLSYYAHVDTLLFVFLVMLMCIYWPIHCGN